MKKIIKIMLLVLMLGVLIPTMPTEAKTKTVTIKKNSDIPNAVKKLHNNAMKKKATNIKVKGNLNKSRKIIKEMESQIQQYNGNGVILLIDATKKPKTSKGYTTYKVTKDCGKCYIYWNKVVDKMEQEAVDWVQTSNTEQDTGATNESANAVLSIINQATNNETSKPIKYAIGTGQKTFAQLTDYEKVKFIDEHGVFSCTYKSKNHVGMYYSKEFSGGSFLEGNYNGMCQGFAKTEISMFMNLGICSEDCGANNHSWSKIYIQSPDTGKYRYYLFDYGLYDDMNKKTSTGAYISDKDNDEEPFPDYVKADIWNKTEIYWHEPYFCHKNIINKLLKLK